MMALWLTAMVAGIVQSLVKLPRCLFYQQLRDSSMLLDMTEEYYKGMNYAWVKSSTFSSRVELSHPILQQEKYSHSLLFWPFDSSSGKFAGTVNAKNDTACLRKHGLNAFDRDDMKEFSAELINSMTYFENLWLTKSNSNDTAHQTIYFAAYTLDKTSKGNEIGRRFRGEIPVKGKDGMNCTNVVYVSVEKTYIICWRVDIDPTHQNSVLKIRSSIWLSNLFQGQDDSVMEVLMNKTQSEQVEKLLATYSFNLKARICKNADGSTIDLFLMARYCSFFMVMSFEKDKFKGWKYPEHSSDQGPVKMNQITWNGTSLDIFGAEYVDNLRFIITQNSPGFGNFNKSSYPNLYYFDLERQSLPTYLGQGILVTFQKQIDENKDSYVSRALLIISAVLTPGEKPITELTIQTRKYYKGSFFGDETFKVSTTGSPLYFKGYYTSDFVVYVTWSNFTLYEPCNMKYFDGKLYIAQINRPERIREAMRFESNLSNPVVIAASPYNNILYIRYRHKLEIFNLQNSFINFSNTFTDYLNSSNTLKLVSSRSYMFKVDTSKTTEPPVLTQKELPKQNLIGLFVGIEGIPDTEFIPIDRVIQDDMMIPSKLVDTFTLPIQKISQVYYYTTSLDDINFGNYLAYQPVSLNQSGKVEMSSFKEEVFEIADPSRRVHNVFSYNCNGKVFLMISYLDNPENILYEAVEGNRLVERMNFYDRRAIDGVQKLSQTQILIHIETLLYELNLENLRLTPIFKSGDYCGEKYTMINHVELGLLTICGGMDLISVYLTDPKKKNVDLSSPIKNLKVEMTTFHSLKSEGIFKVFSARFYNNHFGIITKPTTDISRFTSAPVHRYKLRLFEICTTSTQVEIVTELETDLILDDIMDDISVVLVKDHLVVFAYRSALEGKKVLEFIKVYYISKAMNVVEEKTIDVPGFLQMNLKVNRPLATFLTSKKNILQKKYGAKILLIMTLTTNKNDILKNFDFIDPTELTDQALLQEKKNLLAVLDPTQPSTNCLKLLELPDGFEVDSFGPYFVNGQEEEGELGATILGRKGSQRKVFFLNDHSLSIDFYALDSFENYFTDSKKIERKFVFTVKNYQTNIIKTLTAKFDAIQDYSINKLEVSQKSIDVNLVDIAGSTSYFNFIDKGSRNVSLELIRGSPYTYEFNYDSKIEQIASLIKGSIRMLVRQVPQALLNEITEMVAYKMQYIPDENAFGYPVIDRLYPLSVVDYKALLHANYDLIYPSIQNTKTGTIVRLLNPYFSSMRRCTRFYFMNSPTDTPTQTVACIQITSKDHTSDYHQLSIYLFHKQSSDREDRLPEAAFILSGISSSNYLFGDIQLMSTLNNVILCFTNSKTNVTYRYKRFIVVKNDSALHLLDEPFRDTWSINPCFVNNYFKYPHESITKERFCMLTRIEGHLVQYYCTFQDIPSIDSTKKTDIRAELKSIDIFKYLEDDEKSTLNPSLLIYDQFSNPAASRVPPIVTDKYLYCIYAVETWIGVLVRIDPMADDNKQLENGTVKFIIMSNPFDGFKFDKDVHRIDGNFYIRAFAMQKTNKTYLAYYPLPFELVANFDDYKGFYTDKDMLEPQSNLSSIEPKYLHKIDSYFESLDVLNLDFEMHPSSLCELKLLNTTSRGIKMMREASHLLLTVSEKTVLHLEYYPRIEIAVNTSLLLSKDLKLDIRGMYNTSSSIRFNLISGKYSELRFMLMYLLPLFVVVLVLFLLNWLMNYLFNKMEMPTEARNSPMLSGSVDDLVLKLFSGSKGSHKSGVDEKSRKEQAEDLMSETDKIVHMSLKKVEEQEREELEMQKNLQKKKEIKGVRLLTEDGEGFEEAIQVDYIRDLYKVGVLKVDADQETESELNRAFIQERNVTFFAIEAEREKSILLTPEELGTYDEFDQYMKSRYRNDKHSLAAQPALPPALPPIQKTTTRVADANAPQRRKTANRSRDSAEHQGSGESEREESV